MLPITLCAECNKPIAENKHICEDCIKKHVERQRLAWKEYQKKQTEMNRRWKIDI